MADFGITDSNELWIAADSGAKHVVHPLWLRERANDGRSLDPITQQRFFCPSDLETVRVSAIEANGSDLQIRFDDGATARLSATDIFQEFPAKSAPSLPAAAPWEASDAAQEPFDWHRCSDTAVLHEVLRAYLRDGYVILQGVPTAPGMVLEVARRFGFPRETNFGALFDVKSQPGATDLAYTSLPLDPHTDNPYRTPVPGIQLLHCLTNRTEGGLSTLVDGLAVAEFLRLSAPDSYACLAHTPVRFRYVDAETELVAEAPIIELDCVGRFAAINYSPRLDFVPLLAREELARFYEARRMLDRALKSARFERRFLLADGMLMMFDNRRLLHGRTGFDPRSGLRHLQGCYIDADGPRSLYRVLSRRQK